MDLTTKAAKSALWLVLRFGGRQLANAIAFFALITILTPSEFGIATIALAPALILSAPLRRGFRDVVIQHERPASDILDTAFWANALLAIAVSILLIIMTPAFAALFNESQLSPLLFACSVIPLFTGISAISGALIERSFLHRQLAVAQITASAVATCAAILLAFAGAGAWSLVFFTLLEVAGTSIATLLFAGWRPGLQFRTNELNRQLTFAWPIMFSYTFSAGLIRLIHLIIGLTLTPAATAYFRLATQINQILLQTIITPISNALLPAFSRLTSDANKKFIDSMSASAAIAYPLFLCTGIIGWKAVPLLFGDNWAQSAHLLPIICFCVFYEHVQQLNTHFLIARSKTQTALKNNLFGASLCTALTALGAQIDLTYTGILYTVGTVISIPIIVLNTRTDLFVPIKYQLNNILAFSFPAIISYTTAGLWLMYIEYPDKIHQTFSIVFALFISLFIYFLALRFSVATIFPRYYEPLKSLSPRILRHFL